MALLSIDVIYARPEGQDIARVALEVGARAIDALRESGLCLRYPEIDPCGTALGIFGHRVSPDTLLRDGDRVEIYRPLRVDPKEARRAKARAGSPQRGNRSV